MNFDEWSKDAPNWDDVFSLADNLPSRIYKNGYECQCVGIITYKGYKYPVYSDDYGCQDFIVYRYLDDNNVYQEHEITVRNMAGFLDWWFELNRMKDEHPNEIVQLTTSEDTNKEELDAISKNLVNKP